MNYDVNYFIKKFEAIPEELWGRFSLTNHCAYYHCDEDCKDYYTDAKVAFTELFSKLTGTSDVMIPIGINDHARGKYQQPTPKQRILAALYDIKKMQEPQHTDITKQLAVLPINETSDLITTNILQ